MIQFMGYRRPDGQIGIRNRVLVMASCDCAYQEALRIAAAVPGAVAVGQWHGCLPSEMIVRQLAHVAMNPNMGAVLLVGLGCESTSVDLIAEQIAPSGKPLAEVIIQRDGGSLRAIEKGVRRVRDMAADLSHMRLEPAEIGHLRVALQCGGSDATSGLAANPALGVAVDMLVDDGAVVIMSEPHEMTGTEHILARRAVNEHVASEIYRIVRQREALAKARGENTRHMSEGNMVGGLTTIEEKSLGAILKGGTRSIQAVLRNDRDHLDHPDGPGLYIQDGTEYDVPSITHMTAAGAQVAVFTTGRGSTTGHAIAPVIKVTGNPETYENMVDNMDVNAGRIIRGQASIAHIGQEIHDLVLAVASGVKTKAELLGFDDFTLYDLPQVTADAIRRYCDDI